MKFIKTVKKVVFSRISVCALGISIQVAYLGALFWSLGTMFSYSYFIFAIISLAVSIYIINTETSSDYKLIWIFTVLAFPLFGIMLYLFFGMHRKTPNEISYTGKYTSISLSADIFSKQAQYIINHCDTHIYIGDHIEYYQNGEQLFPAMLEELKKAKDFIFIEFFILENGIMWDSILTILREKADAGIDVRVIYDDMGCLLTLPRKYKSILNRYGIKCCVYGRLKPFWTRNMNNRDHRKMMIIDGTTVLTGGINLADEYINAYEKHGYWKDSAVILKGNAVKEFTKQFLKLWNRLDGRKFSEISCHSKALHTNVKNIAVPFFDDPDDNELLGRNIYINMLNNARKYVYITTPYLIPDNEMLQALIMAAKNGVDTKIITPRIPDKRLVQTVTRSYYRQLIKNGVEIYEYIPGFIHAKNIVSDNTVAVVGTVNLDFRSLYLHHECGVWLCGDSAVSSVKQDFDSTLKQCEKIELDQTTENNLIKRCLIAILRFFSPLL